MKACLGSLTTNAAGLTPDDARAYISHLMGKGCATYNHQSLPISHCFTESSFSEEWPPFRFDELTGVHVCPPAPNIAWLTRHLFFIRPSTTPAA